MQNSSPHLSPLYDRPSKGLFGIWRRIYRHIRDYRFFIWQLVKVSITATYKRSFVGISWMFITPIISVIVWILLHGAGIVDPGETSIPYPAFVLLSTSIWSFFIGAYQTVSKVIDSNGRIMVMTRFPHEVLVVERVLVHLINFLIPFLVNIVVLLFFGVRFTALSLLFPLSLLPLLLLGIALGMVVALLRVVAVDISNIVDQALNLLMYLTPIVYSPKIELGWLSRIIDYNPLAYLIGFSRDVLVSGTFFEPQGYLLFSLMSLVLFILALRLFMASETKLLERLINT